MVRAVAHCRRLESLAPRVGGTLWSKTGGRFGLTSPGRASPDPSIGMRSQVVTALREPVQMS
jgi:hypothetical protein